MGLGSGDGGAEEPPCALCGAERRGPGHAPGRGAVPLGSGRPAALPAPCNSWEAPAPRRRAPQQRPAARVRRRGKRGQTRERPPPAFPPHFLPVPYSGHR